MIKVKLYVLHGKQAGKSIPVEGTRFFVGRAEDCQLRPHSELISRHHCGITIEDGTVLLRDFGSKNGTFINGSRIVDEIELHSGDRLQVGSLEFEVRITRPEVKPEPKSEEPKVEAVKEVAAESFADGSGSVPAILSDTAANEGSASHPAIPSGAPAIPGSPAGYPPAYPQPGYVQPGYPPVAYPQPGYPPAYPQPGYPPAYPQPGYPPAYPQPGYPPAYPQPGYPAGSATVPMGVAPPRPQTPIPPLGQAQEWLNDGADASFGDSSGFYTEGESGDGVGNNSTVILTPEALAKRQAEKAEKAAQAEARKAAELERKKADNAALDAHRKAQAAGQNLADEALRNMLRPF